VAASPYCGLSTEARHDVAVFPARGVHRVVRGAATVKTLGPRYGLESWGDDWWMAFAEDGDYVLYDDAAAALAERDARVAELERDLSAAYLKADTLRAQCDAANARADAALDAQRLTLHERDRAESEAAQWKAKCEAAERETRRTAKQSAENFKAREHAESEAASLRAEVEHLRGENLHPCGARESELIVLRESNAALTSECLSLRGKLAEAPLKRVQRAESSLAAATELLGRWMNAEKYRNTPAVLVLDTGDFFANAPAAPPRTEKGPDRADAQLHRSFTDAGPAAPWHPPAGPDDCY
jgi:hypothetical protein